VYCRVVWDWHRVIRNLCASDDCILIIRCTKTFWSSCMYKFGHTLEGYESVTVSHYRFQCTKLYSNYLCRKYLCHLQMHIFRTSSRVKELSLTHDEEWCYRNLLHKYRNDNNPPTFWSPSSTGIIWWCSAGWSPDRLLVAVQLQRLCRSLMSAEALRKRTCNERAIFDYEYVPDITLSYMCDFAWGRG